MSDFEKKIGKHKVRVVLADSKDCMTPEDKDMDARVKEAVNSAIRQAKICRNPIAKYDQRKKKAFVETADGVKKYVS